MFHKFVYTCVILALYSTPRIETAERRSILEIYNVTCLIHSDLMKSLEGEFHKYANNRFGVSVRLLINRDADKPVHFRAWIDILPNNSIREIRVMDVKLNACSLMRYMTDNLLLKLLLTEFKRTSNFPTSCQFKANYLYRMDNFTVTSDILPRIGPTFNFTFGVEIFVKNKVVGEWSVLGAKV